MLPESSIVDHWTAYRPINPHVLGIETTVPLPALTPAQLPESVPDDQFCKVYLDHSRCVRYGKDFEPKDLLWLAGAAVLLVVVIGAIARR